MMIFAKECTAFSAANFPGGIIVYLYFGNVNSKLYQFLVRYPLPRSWRSIAFGTYPLRHSVSAGIYGRPEFAKRCSLAMFAVDSFGDVFFCH